jgi:hypothetical protein
VINNSDPSVDTEPPPLRFEETRNAPFLDNTEEYFCSIIRFSIQTGASLPLFIPRIQTGQSDPNKTVYIITLVFTVTTAGVVQRNEVSLPVSYIPNNTSPVPGPPLTRQDISTSYYYVHSYQDFANMINATMKSLWNTLSSQVIANIQHSTILPFILFNPDDGKFVLYGALDYFSETITDGIKFELWFNTRLFELMSGFPAYNNGPVGNKNYRILFNNYYNTNVQSIKSTIPDYQAIQVFQEICTLPMFNPVASIVFTSTYIPIQSTNISPAKVFNDSSGLLSNGNNAGLFNIMTDFEVPYSATEPV